MTEGAGPRVAVVDYGIGNVQSVVNACRRTGAVPERIASGGDLERAAIDAIVLPGVGAVGEALRLLRERGLDQALERRVRQEGLPFLGICVGMQVVAETCVEFGSYDALGWIPGRVERLPGSSRLPHMGWNSIELATPEIAFASVDGAEFYFCHSNAMRCPDAFVLARTTHGEAFVSAVRRDNIVGVQFHPEKSSRAGEALIRTFLQSQTSCSSAA